MKPTANRKLVCKIGHSYPLTTAKPDQFRQARWHGRPWSKGPHRTLIPEERHADSGVLGSIGRVSIERWAFRMACGGCSVRPVSALR
jgi:hypothetical protein